MAIIPDSLEHILMEMITVESEIKGIVTPRGTQIIIPGLHIDLAGTITIINVITAHKAPALIQTQLLCRWNSVLTSMA